MNFAGLLLVGCLTLPTLGQALPWRQVFTNGTVHSFALSPDQLRMAVVGQERGVEVRETATGKLLQTLGDPKEDTFAVAWSPVALIVAGRQGRLAFYDPQSLDFRTSKLVAVRTLAFAPDGQTLACGGYSGELGLWDARTGQRTRELQGAGPRPIFSVAFSPDGSLLASAGPGEKGMEDGQIQLWEATTGQASTRLHLERAPFSLAFAPDGRSLATGDWGGFVGFWDVRTGARIAEVRGHPWWIRALAFSPDGTRLLSAGLEDLVVWDAAQKLPVRAVLDAGVSATHLQFGRDGRTVFLGGWTKRRSAVQALPAPPLLASSDPLPRTWALEGRTPAGAAFNASGSQLWLRFPKSVEPLAWPEGRPLPPPLLPADTQGLWDFALGPGGGSLAIAGDPFRLALGRSGEKQLRFRPTPSQVLGVAFGAKPDQVVLRLNEGKMIRVSLTGTQETTLVDKGVFGAFALDPAGRWLALGAGLGVELRSPDDGRLLHWLPIANGSNALAFDGSGSRLAVLDSPPRVWDLDTLEPFPFPEGDPDENGRWEALALDREGRLLALARNPPGTDRGQGEIYLLDVPQGAWITRFLLPSAVRSLAFHPGGRAMVAVPEKGPLRSWDLGRLRDRLGPPPSSPRPVPPLRYRAENSIYSMALTTDGRRVALALATGRIQIWDLDTGTREQTWEAASPYLRQPMAFSPDGGILALGGAGLDLWDPVKGSLIRRLAAPSMRFQALAFTPDGQSLLARGEAGFTRWNLRSGALEEEQPGIHPLGQLPAFQPVEAGLVPLGGQGWAHHQYGFIRILDSDFKVRAQGQGPSFSGYDLPMAASPDHRHLALGAGTRIELWQVAPLLRLGVVGGHSSQVTALAFLRDGRLLSVGFDGLLRVWENPESFAARTTP